MKGHLKLGLILVAIQASFLVLLSFTLYYFLYTYSYSDFYKRLSTRAKVTASYKFAPDTNSSKTVKQMRERYLEHLSNEQEYIIPAQDKKLAETQAQKLNIPAELVHQLFEKGSGTSQSGKTFFAGINYKAAEKNYLVVISAENYYANHHLQFLRTVLIIGVSLAVVFTVFFTLFFSRQIVEPIKLITKQVNKISTDNIHLRLDESVSDAEIRNLIVTFNSLLNRVETTLETHKNFISNASHEFSTPLTAIIGEAELALKKDRPVTDYKEALNTILQEAERLNAVSQALIQLAQTGYKNNKLAFEITRTDELLWQIIALMNTLYPHNQIRFDLDLMPDNPYKLKVNANKQLLQLALTNVLGNACKYSDNKVVTISLTATAKHVVIVIRDTGIGIPANELAHIFDPFFRGSNTKHFKGYGIGLPLTKNIVALHSGKLLVDSVQNSGTSVQIELPLAYL